MTIITAHSGAENTAPNSYGYLKAVPTFGCEAMEVDVRCRRDIVYLNHEYRWWGIKGVPTIGDAFCVAKENNMLINCDLKEGMRSLVALNRIAEDMGVTDNLIFTGNYKSRLYKELKYGKVFLNGVAIAKEYRLKMIPENISVIKKLIEDTGNPNIVGINFKYTFFSEELAEEARRLGLLVSVFTVQDESVYRRLLNAGVYNITTLSPLAVKASRDDIQIND